MPRHLAPAAPLASALTGCALNALLTAAASSGADDASAKACVDDAGERAATPVRAAWMVDALRLHCDHLRLLEVGDLAIAWHVRISCRNN